MNSTSQPREFLNNITCVLMSFMSSIEAREWLCEWFVILSLRFQLHKRKLTIISQRLLCNIIILYKIKSLNSSPKHRASLRQVEHLTRVEQPQEDLHQLGPLVPSTLGIDEHQQGLVVAVGHRLHLERRKYIRHNTGKTCKDANYM